MNTRSDGALKFGGTGWVSRMEWETPETQDAARTRILDELLHQAAERGVVPEGKPRIVVAYFEVRADFAAGTVRHVLHETAAESGHWVMARVRVSFVARQLETTGPVGA